MTAEVRSAVVRLTMDQAQYIAAARQVGDVSVREMGKAEAATKRQSSAMEKIGVSGTTVATGLVGVASAATLTAANFEQSMSQVQAATRESAENMELLRAAAIDAGKDTAFSSGEAAGAIEALAKAGVSTEEVLSGGLKGALDLAAAGNVDVGLAAETAASAMTQFKLSGEDVPHIADLLAAAAGKAQGEVSDMAYALNQSGLVASQMGIDIEEATGTLAAFAAAGLLGSDAGTSFRTMLLRLANPSKKAAELMDDLGIAAYDAQGNFVGIENLAGQLRTALSGQEQATRDAAFATIFGSDAVRAANVLYENGADGIAEWTANVNDAGFAAEQAGIQMDNTAGKWERFKGSLDTALIGSGDQSLGPLGIALDTGTQLLDVMTQIQEMQARSGIGQSVVGPMNFGTGVIEAGANNFQAAWSSIFGGDDAKDEADKVEDAADDVEDSVKAVGRAGIGAGFGLRAYNDAMAGVERRTKRAEGNLKNFRKTLADQRETASDTADSFIGLTDSLNDSEVSLDGWIAKMAEQAKALRDFRLNAQQAAKKGLEEGLIAELKQAGPEGALRMRELANASQEQIGRANKAWQAGQAEIKKYVDAATRKVQLKIDNASALLAINAVQDRLAGLRDKTVHVDIVRTDSSGVDYVSGAGSSSGSRGSGGKGDRITPGRYAAGSADQRPTLVAIPGGRAGGGNGRVEQLLSELVSVSRAAPAENGRHMAAAAGGIARGEIESERRWREANGL